MVKVQNEIEGGEPIELPSPEQQAPYSKVEDQLSGMWGIMDGLDPDKYMYAVYIAQARAKQERPRLSRIHRL